MGLSPESRLTLIHKFVWVFFELTPRALSRYNVIVANLKTHIRILFGVTSDATEPQGQPNNRIHTTHANHGGRSLVYNGL